MNVPARIGGISFLYQDRWLPLVQRLTDCFNDIEILFQYACGILDEVERCIFRQELGRC